MGCCCSKDGSDTDSHIEPFLDTRESDAGSNAPSFYEEEKIGPIGDLYPTWIKDEDAKFCYNCEIKFNKLTERRHHCRRCRNVFCTGCSAHKAAIIAYGLTDEARVCDSCKTDLQTENFYLSVQKPFLTRGENFKRYRMMGMTSYVVKMRLQGDDTIVYDGDGKPEPEIIKLSTITKISMTNLTTFELITPGKSYSFEADSVSTLKTWTEALNLAVRVSKEPPLRQRVEEERRKKYDLKLRDKKERAQDRVVQKKQKERSEAFANIREKYSNK